MLECGFAVAVGGFRIRMLGGIFGTGLLACSVFSSFLPSLSIFWFNSKNILRNLAMKREKRDDAERARGLVLGFLPSIWVWACQLLLRTCISMPPLVYFLKQFPALNSSCIFYFHAYQFFSWIQFRTDSDVINLSHCIIV